MQDLERRQRLPDFPHGPTYEEMLDNAQHDSEYKAILENLKLIYDDESEDDLKILAWVRLDRKRHERKLEAEMKKMKSDDSGSPNGSSSQGVAAGGRA